MKHYNGCRLPGSHYIYCNNAEKILSIPNFEWFDITCLFLQTSSTSIKYVPGPNICTITFLEHGRRLYTDCSKLTVGLFIVSLIIQ